jgi:S-formylglutathione hydrolase FrmB
MCVDSALGNSASYVTVDVPRWIRGHLNTLTDRSDWAIGGFSQGGTCAIQFGAGMPAIYGGILDIAGEIAPVSGTLQNTIDSGFNGSKAKYLAATPRALMRANAPYRDTLAIFAVGELDTRFRAGISTLAASATAAGMTTHLLISAGRAHDWHAVHSGMERALPLLGAHWGLGG